MLFIRKIGAQMATCAAVLLITACASNSHKTVEPANVYNEAKPYDFRKIQKSPLGKDAFGDNPYLQYAPEVSASAISEYQFSVKALQGGNQDLGELQLKNMLEEYPQLSGPAYNLAVLSKEKGNIEESLAYLDIAIERNSYNFDAKNMYASIMREQGDFEAAEEIYDDILKAWGGYAPAYRNLGILYDLYLGKPDVAVVFYRQYNALLDSPDSQVAGWIVDIERRYGLHQTVEQEVHDAQINADSVADEEYPIDDVDGEGEWQEDLIDGDE